MRELLLNERWRPRTLDQMILLPRIRNLFQEGLKQNVILHGHFGTGKTTLARIIIGKWSKDKAYLEINSSFYTSIETLRTKIDDFCQNVYMGLDLLSDVSVDPIKYVFLDEFERTSIQYQDALKAYIEEYSTKNVRFILNTNHIDKISDGIKSRMIQVDFSPQDMNEQKFLKREIYLKIKDQICPQESINISKEQLVKIINDGFPDLRNILNQLQYFAATGEISNHSIDVNKKQELYELIDDVASNYEVVYNFINTTFGPDNIDQMIKCLGSDYCQWYFENKKDKIQNLYQINNLVATASMQLAHSVDPIVVAMSLLGNIKSLSR